MKTGLRENLKRLERDLHSVAWLNTSLKVATLKCPVLLEFPIENWPAEQSPNALPLSAPLGTIVRAQDPNLGGFTGLRHSLAEGQ